MVPIVQEEGRWQLDEDPKISTMTSLKVVKKKKKKKKEGMLCASFKIKIEF